MTKIAEFEKAKVLIVNKGYTALATAAELGISDKQVRRWASTYGWKEQQETESLKREILTLGLATSAEAAINDFQQYVATKDSALADSLTLHILSYADQFKIPYPKQPTIK